jgi:hypothetical protein
MTIPDTAIRNASGQIALKWALERRMPRNIMIDSSQKVYIFTCKTNVCLIWADEEDVPGLIGLRDKICNCNNGTYGYVVVYATQMDVCLFETGERCK